MDTTLRSLSEYFGKLSFPDSSKESLNVAGKKINDADKIFLTGEGRSGYVAELGSRMLNKAKGEGSGKEIYFFKDSNLPSAGELGSGKVLVIAASSSGKTTDVLRFIDEVKKYAPPKDLSVVAFTSFVEGTPLVGRCGDNDIIVETPLGKEDKEKISQREGSYGFWRMISPKEPAMGDVSEELTLIGMYALASGLSGRPVSPDYVNEVLWKWVEEEENIGRYEYLTNAMMNESEVLLFGRGMSSSVANMVANRATHYGTSVRSVSEATSPKLSPTGHLVIISNSANPRYAEDIEGLKKKGITRQVGKDSYNKPKITAIVGRLEPWVEECDNYLVIGNGSPKKTTFFAEAGSPPSVFYPAAAIVLNAALRNEAYKKGITEVLAKSGHSNIR